MIPYSEIRKHSLRSKKRKNPRENKIREMLLDDGWAVLSRGWPDFLCVKPNGKKMLIKAVEVKRASQRNYVGNQQRSGLMGGNLTKYQRWVKEILESLGLKVQIVRIK